MQPNVGRQQNTRITIADVILSLPPFCSPANEKQRPKNIPSESDTTNKQIPMLTKNHTMKIALKPHRRPLEYSKE